MFAHQTRNALSQDVVEAFDVICFAVFSAFFVMALCGAGGITPL